MFWLLMIAIIAGTYYFVKWGKKKAEQQGREAAERETQALQSQPPAQLTGDSAAPPLQRCHSIEPRAASRLSSQDRLADGAKAMQPTDSGCRRNLAHRDGMGAPGRLRLCGFRRFDA